MTGAQSQRVGARDFAEGYRCEGNRGKGSGALSRAIQQNHTTSPGYLSVTYAAAGSEDTMLLQSSGMARNRWDGYERAVIVTQSSRFVPVSPCKLLLSKHRYHLVNPTMPLG